MSQDVIHSQEQLSIDEITSTFGSQIFDVCSPDLFQETLIQNSDENSPCIEITNDHFGKINGYDQDNNNNSNNNICSNISIESTNSNNNEDLSSMFDFDFTASPKVLYPSSTVDPLVVSAGSIAPNPLTHSPVFEEDLLSSVPSYSLAMNLSSESCSLLSPTGFPALNVSGVGNVSSGLPVESSGIFSGNGFLGSYLHELEYEGDTGGVFCDSIQRAFAPGNLLALGGGFDGESQQMPAATTVGAVATPPPSAADINGLDAKAVKLSVEQRKEKIHRYLKKRNQRNFSKKIKYACRKTLADSRPRVRGRFAKNDEFGETHRQASSSHHEDDEDDYVVIKEEGEMGDSSDIFAHISGLNSLNCNYTIRSWN